MRAKAGFTVTRVVGMQAGGVRPGSKASPFKGRLESGLLDKFAWLIGYGRELEGLEAKKRYY